MKNTGLEFLELTKYPHLSESDQEKDLPCPQLETPESGEQIDLPGPESISLAEISIQTAINNRRSLRKFSTTPLSMEELSWLLWATQGVKEKLSHATLRTVPSAGARHPFDTYLAVANVSGLKPGLYRYLALTHKLVLIREDSQIGEKVATACIKQKWIAKAAATFFWAAVPYRTTWRYSERGWRYIFLDAGHICQNLYLACEAVAAGCCAVDAFDDDALNQLLGLDGKERFVLYAAPVGHK
ncbi:MAG: SagB/ThcOx family dehydrogenase [Bacillota bacterium]|jgi:SagB-type dehydrogenase family enzyme